MMEGEGPFETVTKLEVAERQLRLAIRLFFERRDIVGIHTLGAAAEGVLSPLAKAKGVIARYEFFEAEFGAEKRKEILDSLRKPQNFFKHSGKDPNETLKFYYEDTEYQLIEAIILWVHVTQRPPTPEMGMFFAWFVSKYPDWFHEEFSRPLIEEIHSANFDDFEANLKRIDERLQQEASGVNKNSK
jgi:hypothetical protein